MDARVLLVGGFVATFLSFTARRHWLADLLANLRVQQVIGLLLILALFCAFRRWRWALVTVVLVAVHVPWFFSAFEPRATERPTELTLMVANVLTSNPHHDQVISQIAEKDPDVIAILELGTPLQERMQSELAESYPYRVTNPQDAGNFGIGVYSKLQFDSQETFVLNIESIPTIAVEIRKDGRDYRLIASHPPPPMGSQSFRDRNEHLSKVAERVVAFREGNPEMSVVLLGDFNLTPWSPLMDDFESTTGLSRAGRGFGLTPTWYAQPLFPFGLVLDHGFISDDLVCVGHDVCGPNGSDHRAVFLKLGRLADAHQ